MNRLNEQYSDRVDFFHLDFDVPETREIMRRYDVRDRSYYVLLDADGSEITRWIGPLDEAIVRQALDALPTP